MPRILPILSIAGSDSSGGAGIQADIKTISALGGYAMTAITAITAQNTAGVSGVEAVSPAMVAAQIAAVYADTAPAAVKTGMLYGEDTVVAVADALSAVGVNNLVIDPVMVSTSGSMLLRGRAMEAIVGRLFPMATLITPNAAEARAFTSTDDPALQIARLHEMGARNVLVKGGDIDSGSVKTDWLSTDFGREAPMRLEAAAVATANTHGTGCTLSAAIATLLASGHSLPEAVAGARTYIGRALRAGAAVDNWLGHGPVDHFFAPHPLIILNDNN